MKPTVLIFVGAYLPGYKAGGPVRSIANLVEALGDEFDFRIVTLDRDMADEAPYPGIEAGVWTQVGRARVLYLAPEALKFRSIYRLLKTEKADFLYLNSFFGRPFSIFPMLARTLGARGQSGLVLAPRGEFARGALRLHRFRKRLWIEAAGYLRVYREATYQASSPFEEQDIRRGLWDVVKVRRAQVVVASDLPQVTPSSWLELSVPFKEPGKLRIVFLSRISPMKNLVGALRILGGTRGAIEFHIYGPAEDAGYWEQCQRELQKLPTNVQVEVHAQVEHERVKGVLAAHHVLLLPTQGENFGHVIYEALAAGVPAVISDRTPWRALREAGAGWDLPLERPELFREALEGYVDMDNETFLEASRNACRFAQRFARDEEMVAANRSLFVKSENSSFTDEAA